MKKPLVKVCGITQQHDLALIEKAEVSFAGFIFASQSPRYIPPDKVAGLESTSIKRVGVFTETSPKEICRIMRIARLDFAQLHGPYTEQDAQTIGKEQVIRVFWPDKYQSTALFNQDLEQHAASAALFLLDAGQTGGGSGQQFNWQVLQEVTLPLPTLLAGGLTPSTAQRAWLSHQHCLTGLDVNSGVEFTPGHKDARLIMELMHNFTATS